METPARPSPPPPGRLRGAAIIALLVSLGCLIAYQLLPPLRVAISPYDRNFIRQAHAIEQLGALTGRWTRAETVLVIPRPLANGPLLLRLDLLNARPLGQPDPEITVLADGQPIAALSVGRTVSGGPRRYLLMLPAGPGARIAVALAGSTILLPADPRPLGAFLVGFGVAPAVTAVRLPPPQTLAALVAAALLCYGLLLAVGGRPLPAGAATSAIMLALLAWLAVRPLDILPFVTRLAALPAIALAAVGLARALAPPVPTARGLAVRRADLLVYLGVAWWAMPLYQLALTLDGAPNVSPNPVTAAIGVALSVALLVALVLQSVGRAARGRRAAQWAQLIARWALVLASVAHTIFIIWFAFQRSGPDFWIHFRAVRGVARDGLPLYDLAGIAANHFGFSYKWPPFYAALLSPFALADGAAVLTGYRWLNTALLLLVALAALRQTRSWATAGAVLLVFNFRPAADAIAFGQVDVIMLAGSTLALLALARGRDAIAGGVVMVMALIKIYPALLFGFFLAQRRWGALLGAAVAGAASLALSVAVFGWPTHWLYLTQVFPIMGSGGGGTAWIENQTFNGFLSRFFAEQIVADPFGTPLTRLATYAFFALLCGAAALLALPREDTRAEGAPPPLGSLAALQLSLFLLVMIVAVPAAWIHYQTVAILPLLALLLRDEGHASPGAAGGPQTSPPPRSARHPLSVAERGPAGEVGAASGPYVSLGAAVALASAYALLAYGNQWSFTDSAVAGGIGVLGYSYKFYGLMTLAALVIAQLWPAFVAGARAGRGPFSARAGRA